MKDTKMYLNEYSELRVKKALDDLKKVIEDSKKPINNLRETWYDPM